MRSATRLADDETGGGLKPEVELRPEVKVAQISPCAGAHGAAFPVGTCRRNPGL